MVTYISPHYKNSDFPSGISLDQKIDIFSDQVIGWQLDIAQQCVDKIPNSGFAVLHIIFSYFEMIAKSIDGYNGKNRSREYFKKGFIYVFKDVVKKDPEINDPNILEKVIYSVYDNVRCGLYHIGMTEANVKISLDYKYPIYYIIKLKELQINHSILIKTMLQHFNSYIVQLRDPQNIDLRKNFNRHFQ